jgi:hypothetical protein
VDSDGEPVRIRFAGEEVGPLMCEACDCPSELRGSFEWSEASRRIFARWRLFRRFGGEGPRDLAEMGLWGELDALERGITEATCRNQNSA